MPSLFTIALYYFILLGALTGWLFQGRRRRWKIGGMLTLCGIWCALWLWERPATRLTVLADDGGHAVHVRGPGLGNEWLIDCGGDSAADSLMKPYLRAQGVNRLSHFLLTHGEGRFTGGAQEVCDLFQPRNIYVSPVHSLSSDYNEFLLAVQTNSALRRTVRPGDQLGPFIALFPGTDALRSRADDNPIVLRAEINGTRVLLLSDLSHAGQNALLNTDANSVRADIVVAGMPEHSEPLGDGFLDFVQPRVIVIADSDFPADHKASRDLKERLARRNVPVFYTSDMDAVTVTIRPGSWEVRAMNGTRAAGKSSK